jgi:hypothetical protein
MSNMCSETDVATGVRNAGGEGTSNVMPQGDFTQRRCMPAACVRRQSEHERERERAREGGGGGMEAERETHTHTHTRAHTQRRPHRLQEAVPSETRSPLL